MKKNTEYVIIYKSHGCDTSRRDVAQFGSASGLGPEGRRFESCHPDHEIYGSLAQLGERLPYKQDVTGSSPVTPTILKTKYYAGVAQLVEQLICNQQVAGSSPITSSKRTYSEYVLLNGRVPEWPKGTDCKSAAFSFGGSNPPSSTTSEQALYRLL